ncbi:MAG: DUF2846 domain-containing protein [Bacteroidota bacterium]
MKNLLKRILIVSVFFGSSLVFSLTNSDPSNDVVTVHVYRPKKLVGFAWVFNLKVNGENYGKVKNGDHLILQFKPGTTTFGVKKKTITLDLKPGNTYYLRTFIAAGVYIGSLDIVEVTETFAKNELERKEKQKS